MSIEDRPQEEEIGLHKLSAFDMGELAHSDENAKFSGDSNDFPKLGENLKNLIKQLRERFFPHLSP